jgi:aldose 1-epimerase
MLTLRAGHLSLVLAPEYGGSIVGWTTGPVPVLRRPQPDAIMRGDVRGFGCFPLLPFCNRIAHGRFEWDGRSYELDRNFGDHPHTIHGVGWQSAWTLRAVSNDAATLTLVHKGVGAEARRWPFAFEAAQRVTLTEAGVVVILRVTNRHDADAPVGLGLHPYFPRAGNPTLRFVAAGVWQNGADSLPERNVAVPADWDHREGRDVGSTVLDNCFTDWDGRARIDVRTHVLTIEASAPFRHLQVYTPAGRDFCCVEPVSHVPDALNHAGQSMDVLAPGETLEGRITLSLRAGGKAISP